jgi:hypothetical protein
VANKILVLLKKKFDTKLVPQTVEKIAFTLFFVFHWRSGGRAVQEVGLHGHELSAMNYAQKD